MLIGKIHVSVMLLGPMLAGAGTAGIAWATLGGRVTAIEAAHAEFKATVNPRVSTLEGAVQDLKVDMAVVKTQTKAIEDGIDRMEDRMGTRR